MEARQAGGGLVFPEDMGPEDRADISAKFLHGLIKRSTFGYREQKAGWMHMARKTYQMWKEPLDLLELFIALSTQMSGEFSSAFYGESVLYKTLCHLHGAACSASLSIYTLLSYGLADHALVCWRNLYEIAVISQFILDNPEVAQRYHDHRYIQELQGLRALENAHPLQKENKALQRDIRELEEKVAGLTYEKNFKLAYGWTGDKSVRNFKELESCVGLDTIRPIYKAASQIIHADANSVFFRISLALSEFREDKDIILLANIEHGLALPGSWTADVLAMLNGVLLKTRPSFFPHDVMAMVSSEMADDITQKFYAITPVPRQE